ncbi:MAG TPA: MFS transporter [Anaerolineales bacterium]
MSSYTPPPHGFRTFLILWVSQSVSVFGSAVTFFAITIWLTQVLYPSPEQKPQLALALSAVSLGFALPNVFSAPLAGAWADRHDRRRTMLAADVLNGLLSILLVWLVVTRRLDLGSLVVMTVLYSVLASFHFSAFDTSYAMIVSEAQLPRANGMMQTIWSLSGILSPALAAAIITLPGLARQGTIPGYVGARLATLSDGTALAIGLDAITFFLAALTLGFLRIPSPQHAESGKEGERVSLWQDVRIGAQYIWQRRPLLWLLGTFTLANFASSPLEVFQPLLVKFNLAPDWSARGLTYEAALALLVSVGSVGGVLGGVLISLWGGLRRRRVYGVVVAILAAGLVQIAFGLSGSLYASAALLFVFHGLIPVMNSHSQTIWQTQTPRELQGRVFAVRRLIAQFTWPLATALAGWVGGALDPGLVLAFLGLTLSAFCVAQLFNRQLLRVEDKAYLDSLAAVQSSPPVTS